MKDYVDVIADSTAWNGYRNLKITIRIDAIQYYAYNTDIVSGKLYLEVFLEQNEKYTISDTTSVHQFLNAVAIMPRDFNNIKDDLASLQIKVNELETALKFAPFGSEYTKAQQHFEELLENKK